MLVVEKLAGVAPGVNLQEPTSHMPLPSANKAAHSGFETQRRRHQKVQNRDISGPHKKELCPPKNPVEIKNRKLTVNIYQI